jgi:hypothetical protein
MPLDPAAKRELRDKVSTANKSNVDQVAERVAQAQGTLAEDDKDFARLAGWLEDLAAIKGGGVPGKY